MNLSVRRQLSRFLVIGVFTVLIDLLIYQMLLAFLSAPLAKGISFLSGTFFAYQFNRTWTFQGGNSNIFQVIVFSSVYVVGMGSNVGINTLMLNILPSLLPGRIILSFICATVISASVNFIGMKLLVFNCKYPVNQIFL